MSKISKIPTKTRAIHPEIWEDWFRVANEYESQGLPPLYCAARASIEVLDLWADSGYSYSNDVFAYHFQCAYKVYLNY